MGQSSIGNLTSTKTEFVKCISDEGISNESGWYWFTNTFKLTLDTYFYIMSRHPPFIFDRILKVSNW